MKKKIAILFLLIVSMNICTQILIASTTAGYPTSTVGEDESIIANIVGVLGKTLIVPIMGLVASVLLLVENIFDMAFNSIAGHGFPYADSVIFNAVPILDANFINPTDPNLIQGVVKTIYNTVWSISAAFFSLALIFIGIKLATETIAHQKAKYKEAILSWIVGLLMLFMIHFFMSFILSLNEQLVIIACNIATDNNSSGATGDTDTENTEDTETETDTDTAEGGSTDDTKVTSLATYFKENILDNTNLFTIVASILFDFNYTNVILWGILLGQSVIVLFAYFKRMFYVVVLAFFAPVIIVINTYQKTITGKSNTLSNWVKEFSITVFEQAIQAFLYAVIIQIIKGASTEEAKAGAGMISIAALFLVLKLDDIAKSLIGIKDGMSGGLRGGLSAAMGTMALLKTGKSAVKNVGDNFGKIRNGKKNIRKEEKALEASGERYKRQQETYGTVDENNNYSMPNSTVKSIASQAPIKVTQDVEEEKSSAANNVKSSGTNNVKNENSSNGNNTLSDKEAQDVLQKFIKAIQSSGINEKQKFNPEIKTSEIGENKNAKAYRVENENQQQMAGPFNSQAELDRFNKNKLKAFEAKENYEKEKATHQDAIKSAKQLRRQGIIGSVGAVGFGAAGGMMGLGSGDIKTAMTTTMGGAVVGDKIGEDIGKTKIAGLPTFVAKSIDAQLGYSISGALDKTHEILDEKIGGQMRKAQVGIAKSMTKNNVIAMDSAAEFVAAAQKKENLAVENGNRNRLKRAKKTGQRETIKRTAEEL